MSALLEQDFASALFADWGGPARTDVLRAVDHAVAMGWADPERLAVGGWSCEAALLSSAGWHTSAPADFFECGVYVCSCRWRHLDEPPARRPGWGTVQSVRRRPNTQFIFCPCLPLLLPRLQRHPRHINIFVEKFGQDVIYLQKKFELRCVLAVVAVVVVVTRDECPCSAMTGASSVLYRASCAHKLSLLMLPSETRWF